MKNKNHGVSDSERKQRIKKQLISTGVYIALAAAVLGITSNSVKKILNSADGYDIPDIKNENRNIVLPELKTDDKTNDSGTSAESNTQPDSLPEQKEFLPGEIIVSDSPENISAEVTESAYPSPETSEQVSGEPPEENSTDENVGDTLQEDLSRFDSPELPKVMLRPTAGYISREFSRDELIYTPTMNDFRTHDGIDIAGDIGSPVVAFADGVVEDVYDDPFMGTTVVIKHSGGLVSCYSNLSAELPQNIRVGSVVSVGSTVGGIGETAIIESAEVPHVHFELYKDELCIDPEEYLS